jgi:hypothetical protein
MMNREPVDDLEGLDAHDRMLASDMDYNSAIYADIGASNDTALAADGANLDASPAVEHGILRQCIVCGV